MLKKLSFLLLAVVILVMITATIVEKFVGSATMIYGSWWFAALWAVLAISGLIYCLRRQMLRRPVLFLLHLSFGIILLGALITHIWGVQGLVHLRVGEPVCQYLDEENFVHPLPYVITLDSFEVVCYPGTTTPMDYVSHLNISSIDASSVHAEESQVASIQGSVSMNHPLSLGYAQPGSLPTRGNQIGPAGASFLQSSYDSDLQGSLLAYSSDPVGISITYLGYGLLFLSMLLLLILPNEGFRRLLTQLRHLSLMVIVLLTFASAASLQAKPRSIPAQQAHEFCSLYVYYNGRICPLQTVAKDFTYKLYGKSKYKECNAEQVFTGWVLFPYTWMEEPLKERKPQYQIEQEAVKQMLLAGEFTRLFPIGAKGDWYSPHSRMPNETPVAQWTFIRHSLDYLAELAGQSDYEQFSATIAKIRKYQQEQAAEVLPSDTHFRAEMFYNHADYTRPMAMAFATLGIILFFCVILCAGRQKHTPRWLNVSSRILQMLALLYLLCLFGLRWFVSGHLPLANGFETMQFMAIVVLLLALLMSRTSPLLTPIGYLLTGLTLLVSTFGQSNPQITPLMPVLQSPLLSLHVCVIMLSYSLLGICALVSLAVLLKPKSSPIQAAETLLTRAAHIVALFAMAAGIFLGAIWANVSWGRYWGWDPKEVWALITLLVYSFPLHAQSLSLFRQPRIYHLYMVLAFLTVLMTYFGVNFLLGGMHSYATQ